MTKTKKLELISQLSDILQELDWVFAVPADDDTCRGLIVGEIEFVSEVVQSFYGDDVEITTANEENDGEPILNFNKTKH